MKLRTFIFSGVLVGLLHAVAAAQTSASVVKVSPGEATYKVKKGTSARVTVVMEVQAGYHVNSNRPSDKNLIATALKLERGEGLAPGAVTYPKAKLQKFGFSDKPLSVFEGRVEMKFLVRALPSAKDGAQNVRGKLTVQACNDEACLRPQTIDVSIPIQIQ
ncbi:MAG TPA: protein-disulfide reductase DsbD domain-containing protein [Blastocatellia bacterium]|nr:protein-disulfide reductase DsbD domain-containing protein [Blastocatellia bacterium]